MAGMSGSGPNRASQPRSESRGSHGTTNSRNQADGLSRRPSGNAAPYPEKLVPAQKRPLGPGMRGNSPPERTRSFTGQAPSAPSLNTKDLRRESTDRRSANGNAPSGDASRKSSMVASPMMAMSPVSMHGDLSLSGSGNSTPVPMAPPAPSMTPTAPMTVNQLGVTRNPPAVNATIVGTVFNAVKEDDRRAKIEKRGRPDTRCDFSTLKALHVKSVKAGKHQGNKVMHEILRNTPPDNSNQVIGLAGGQDVASPSNEHNSANAQNAAKLRALELDINNLKKRPALSAEQFDQIRGQLQDSAKPDLNLNNPALKTLIETAFQKQIERMVESAVTRTLKGDYTKELKDLTRRCSETVADVSAQSQKVDSDMKKQGIQLDELNNKFDELSKFVRVVQRNEEKTYDKVVNLGEDFEKLENDVGKLGNDVGKLDEGFEKLKRDFVRKSNEHSARIGTHDTRFAKVEQAHEDLITKVDTSLATAEQARTQLSKDLETRFATALQERKQVIDDMSPRLTRLEQAQTVNGAPAMQNQQLVAIDKSTLDALKNDIMGAAAVIDTNAAWFSKEMDEVGEKVHDLRTDMNKFIQVKPAGLRMEVEKLRDEGFLPFKTATEQRQTATEQRLAALDVEVKKVRDEELVPLKTATEQRLTALDDEVMEIPALKSDAQRLNGQFQNLNGQLQTANQSIQTLNQHCQMLFNGHNVFQGQIAALEQNRDSFARGISQLKERFDNLTTEDLQQAMIYVIQQTYPDAPHFLARLLEMEKELAKEQEIVEQLQGNANAGGGADEALVQQTLQEVQELKHQFSNFQHTSAAYAKYADHQKTIDDLELETRERKSGDNGIKLRFTDIGLALERMSKRISDWEQKLAGLPVDKLKELAAITQELKELCARLPILEAYVGKLLTITKALNSNFDNPLEGLEWDPLSDHAQSEED